jgi:chemotaxis protein methyltransferase CheR
VTFDKANLMGDFQRLGVFDVIFCRNVMIYFDPAMKQAVLGRLAQALSRDGFLMLGATETTIGLGRDLVAAPQRPWLCWPRTQSDEQPRLRLVR